MGIHDGTVQQDPKTPFLGSSNNHHIMNEVEKEQVVRLDQTRVIYNLMFSAFLALLTVITISASNHHIGLVTVLGVLSALASLQAFSLTGKNLFRFFADGFRHFKSVELVYTSFLLSSCVAYINIYEALLLWEIIEKSFWS